MCVRGSCSGGKMDLFSHKLCATKLLFYENISLVIFLQFNFQQLHLRVWKQLPIVSTAFKGLKTTCLCPSSVNWSSIVLSSVLGFFYPSMCVSTVFSVLSRVL